MRQLFAGPAVGAGWWWWTVRQPASEPARGSAGAGPLCSPCTAAVHVRAGSNVHRQRRHRLPDGSDPGTDAAATATGERLSHLLNSNVVQKMAPLSVVDPNTSDLDPDPEFWNNLYPDPGLDYQFCKAKSISVF